jgi:hypothetical protein
MDAYVYQAALWCGPCMIRRLVEEKKASPGAFGMGPAQALQQIVSANGFTDENDYDSDDLPKGPNENGGGEADTPQHCDGCGAFLENPLTGDGVRYVNEKLTEHARDGSGNAEVLKQWGEHYNAGFHQPGSTTLEDLQFEYSMEDDDWGGCMSWWFTIAGELYNRGAPIPEYWRYQPGLHPVDPDDRNAPLVAGATTDVLMRFMEDIEDDAKRLRAEGKDY